jgi:hypothetical protein
MLRIAHCLDNCLTNGGEVVSTACALYPLGIFVVLISVGGRFNTGQ